jgi:hypothetical protein
VTIVPAAWLAFSVREVYVLPILATSGLLLHFGLRPANLEQAGHRWVALAWIVGPLAASLVAVSASDLLFSRYSDVAASYGARLVHLPLLLLRAVFGGPWGFSDETGKPLHYEAFDYVYHVLQLGVLLAVVGQRKQWLRSLDAASFFGLLVWCIGAVAVGVHTAYLAVALPFVLPALFDRARNLGRFLFMSGLIFISANAAYWLLGLRGAGLILKETGY